MKTNLKVVITTVGVAVLMQLNTVVYADQSYSAVASTSGWAFGAGVGYSSSYNADVKALNQCHSQGKGQCYIVHRFRGAGCVAFARVSGGGAGGWGVVSGYSNNQSSAHNRAVNECNNRRDSYGPYCQVTSTVCTEN